MTEVNERVDRKKWILYDMRPLNDTANEVAKVQVEWFGMKKFFGTAVVVGAVLAGSVFFAPAPSITAAAQQRGAGQAATTAKPAPRTSWDGKPDLTGVWQGAKLSARAYGLAELDRLYQPAAKEKMKTLSDKDDPIHRCAVYGYPRRMATDLPFQIVQGAGVIVLLDNRPHVYRYIATDGRKHDEDVFPSYQGDSVGRWEGDTLVVDVTALNGGVWLAGAQDQPTPARTGGWITSDAEHVVERWRLLDTRTLEYQATVEDPKVLTGPWTTTKIVLERAPLRKLEDEGHCIPEGIDWVSPALR